VFYNPNLSSQKVIANRYDAGDNADNNDDDDDNDDDNDNDGDRDDR